MKKILLSLLATLLISAGLAQNSFADRRSYVWTYEYMTMPKGVFELEYYLTEQQPDITKLTPNIWKHYAELEYGITNHWDIALYQTFEHKNTSDKSTFRYEGFKARTRYRIWEKDKLPLDTLLYLEYIRDANFKKANVLEGKLVVAKDIEKFNISYNQILKQELESKGKTEHEYAAGISYALLPQLRLGIESKGNYTEGKYYAGPTIAWATSKFWTALGAVAGLNDKSDDMQVRLIVGVPF